MLAELRVCQLGVVEDLTVVLGPGLCALTGETGAGKTLLVDAIELLIGGTADPQAVRPGADEATVEGRFTDDSGTEVVLTRVVPASGRSRAYVDGRMASAAQLEELGAGLVDLHGQHTHQSLLGATAQRRALDRFGSISSAEVASARRVVRELAAELDGLGGDARTRARELDLLRYQLSEIDAARLTGPDEADELRAEEERLAASGQLREAAQAVAHGISSDGGVLDGLGPLLSILSGLDPVGDLRERLVEAQASLQELGTDARLEAERIADDPARLQSVRERRQLLTTLRRKYGDSLRQVLSFADEARSRAAALEDHDRRAAELEARLSTANEGLRVAVERLWSARLAAAPLLSRAVEERLRELALPSARFCVRVSPPPPASGSTGSSSGASTGGLVTWELSANPGEPPLPLAKVASGGELARTMLAARLAIWEAGDGKPADSDSRTEGPSTLVFDEVDAGIGGEAAVAVGRALADLGEVHQVLVVTHLPQVAAFATSHLVARKDVRGGRAVAEVAAVDGAERVVELSRMLSGSPDSATARRHAEELLQGAGRNADRSRNRRGG